MGKLFTDLKRKAMLKLVGLYLSFQYKRNVENGVPNALSRVSNLLSIDALYIC